MKTYYHHYNDTRVRLFLLLTLFLSLSYFYFGTYRNWPYKIESDGKYYYQFLVSALMDMDFDFTNNYNADKYEWMRTPIDHYMWRKAINPKTGRPVNLFTIGLAILWSPFFVIASIFGKIINTFYSAIDMNPYGRYFQYTTMYSSVLYCITSLYLLYFL